MEPFGEVQCLAADKTSGHAVGCDVAIIDEAGLLDENKRNMWQAVSTSRSDRDGRLISISVRGHSPMFRERLERQSKPGFYVQRHEPERGADPFDPGDVGRNLYERALTRNRKLRVRDFRRVRRAGLRAALGAIGVGATQLVKTSGDPATVPLTLNRLCKP